jgi:hypothetical protein
MYDLNFFATTVTKKEKSKATLFAILSVSFLAILLVGFVVMMQILGSGVQKDIQDMKDYMVSTEVVDKLGGLDQIKQKQQVLADYSKALGYIDRFIDTNDRVNGTLLDRMASAIPDTLMLRSMVLSAEEILLDGTAPDQPSIAMYLRSLKDLGVFAKVELVSNTQALPTDPTQNFTIRCVLKDVVLP